MIFFALSCIKYTFICIFNGGFILNICISFMNVKYMQLDLIAIVHGISFGEGDENTLKLDCDDGCTFCEFIKIRKIMYFNG